MLFGWRDSSLSPDISGCWGSHLCTEKSCNWSHLSGLSALAWLQVSAHLFCLQLKALDRHGQLFLSSSSLTLRGWVWPGLGALGHCRSPEWTLLFVSETWSLFLALSAGFPAPTFTPLLASLLSSPILPRVENLRCLCSSSLFSNPVLFHLGSVDLSVLIALCFGKPSCAL